MFIYVPAPHSIDILCNVLIDCLLDWIYHAKLFIITLGNYSTDHRMIVKFKDKS